MEVVTEKKGVRFAKADIIATIVIALVPILCMVIYMFWPGAGIVTSVAVLFFAWWMGMVEWSYLDFPPSPKAFSEWMFFLFCFWTPGFLVAAVVCLFADFGVYKVMVVTLIFYAADAAALVVGSSVESPKLSEFISFAKYSPNKSIAGTDIYFKVAWILFVLAWVLAVSTGVITSWPETIFWAISAFILPIIGLFGDLNESYLKRSWGVGNSAQAAPWYKLWARHGGFLDREDDTSTAAIWLLPTVAVVMIAAILAAILLVIAIVFAALCIFFSSANLSFKKFKTELREGEYITLV